MSFAKIKNGLAMVAVLLLVACGGGGSGDAGTSVLPGTGSGSGGSGSGSGGTTASATVAVSLSSATVTAASPATVTVTLRDATGNPMAGKVVDLKTSRGNLAALSVSSVATNASGNATAVLSADVGGVSGADEVVAVANLGTTTVQGSSSFTVAGSVPTIGLTTSSTTLRASTGAATVRAVLKDAAGNLLANQAVLFSTVGNNLSLSAPSAATDGFGTATITVRPANAGVTAAETLTASATVAGSSVSSQLVLQLLADAPTMSLSVSSSIVTATTPATLSVLVKDANGVAVGAGTVVSALSSFGLTAFDASTAATDATGLARVVVSPKTSTSNGADQIVTSATVGGVTVTAQTVVQVSSATSSTAQPFLQTSLSSTSISAASPATVTATLSDGKGGAVAGQVVTFSVVRGLARTNVGTALTGADGKASVILSPTSTSLAGADEVVASVSFAGTTLQSTKGFQIQATNVSLDSFTSAAATLGAYGQTTLTVGISGATAGTPVNVSVSSACVTLGKATLSPSVFSATTNTVSLQYKDNGCGALQVEDKLQAAIVGASSTVSLTLPISSPTASSLAFVAASPEIIYIKGSGFTESSTLSFEVRDGAGNILPNRSVTLSLLTRSGGVTMEGGTADVVQVSDASGKVSVRVNAGTIPTPVRVSAKLTDTPAIATVSSNLSVAVGLPSQLNFSLSQQTRNIEGMNIDGTVNTYNIIASDRSGNPVPAGTSVNFVAEGGQVEAIKQTQLVSGIARTSAGFVSAAPRPADGRVTITAYALGEESFIDQNGNNVYDAGEPFQDLGNLFRDRLFDGVYDATVDEFIPTNIANGLACLAPSASGTGVTAATNALLAFDPSIPSVAGTTCDSAWSGAGKVYVRRATETVLSASGARALWASKGGLDNSCTVVALQTGPQSTTSSTFNLVQGGEVWYAGSGGAFLPFIVADRNTFPTPGPGGTIGRLNPMAAGTTVSASTPTTGLTVRIGGGTPVPSTSEATSAVIGLSFDATTRGVVFVTFTSPSGVATTYAVTVDSGVRPTACPALP